MTVASLVGPAASSFGYSAIARSPRGASPEGQRMDNQKSNVIISTAAGLRKAALREMVTAAVDHGLHTLYGGVNTINQAAKLLFSLPLHVPSPEFSVDPDGEIALDWSSDDGILSISVGPTGGLSYAVDVAGARAAKYFEFNGEIPAEILSRLGAFD